MFVDDAYDAPPLDQDNVRFFQEFLNSREYSDLCVANSNLYNLETQVKDALVQRDLENEKLIMFMNTVFDNLINLPGQVSTSVSGFSKEKYEEILKIDPLTKLFQQQNMTIEVLKSGSIFSLEKCDKYRPEIIFMDYLMVPEDNIDESILILNKLLKKYEDNELLYPIIIVMSNRKIEDKSNLYLKELRKGVGRKTEDEASEDGKQVEKVNRKKRVMAARFGVIEKKWISEQDNNLMVNLKAGAVLLEILEGSEFDSTLQQAMESWKKGLDNAIEKLEEYLWDLDRVDFAYLIRYRLQKEGEAFAVYLEWFLGEVLQNLVDESVNWREDAFKNLNNSNLNQKIVGAHPHPSDVIARLYQNVRISGQENHLRNRFQLGDLFLSEDKTQIRMVYSPDCDLMAGGGREPAPRVATVGGKILDLKGQEFAASELIIIENKPKSIKWDKSDIAAHSNDQNAIDSFYLDSKQHKYFGTLRPLFAQKVQKEVLNQFARVGTEVPPPVYITTPVSVYIKKDDQTMEKLENIEGSNATVILSPGETEKFHKVIFSRKFAYQLIEELENMPDNEIYRGGRSNKRKIVENKEEFCKELLFNGLTIGKSPYGMKILSASTGAHWLEIEIDYDTLSFETPLMY